MNRAYLVLIGLGLVVMTTWAITAPSPDKYDHHMSYNEWYYTEVLNGDLEDPFMPPGLVSGGHVLALIGVPDTVALRLVSIFALVGLVAFLIADGQAQGAALVGTLPWVLVWGSRAQTDMAMTALVVVGLVMALRAPDKASRFAAGGIIGLSTLYKPVGLLALVAVRDRWVWLGAAVGTLPFAVWVLGNLDRYVSFHAGSSVLFGDTLQLLFALPLALGATVLLFRRYDPDRSPYLVAAGAFAVFAFVKAPYGHEYYLLPVAVLVAMAAPPHAPRTIMMICMANLVLGAALVASLGGTL